VVKFVQYGTFFRGEDHFQRVGRADLDTFQAADTFIGNDDRLSGLIHGDAVDRTGAFAAGSAGDTFSCQQSGATAGAFRFIRL